MDFNSKHKSSEIEEILDSVGGKADKSSLAAVATSGSYNDLSNKPTIPAAVTESTVSGWGFTKNTGTYSKPSGGIPKTDLASTVQTSLGKADTALQSYTEQYKGTVTKVKINGSEKSPDSNGLVDLGTIEVGGGKKYVIGESLDANSIVLKPNEVVSFRHNVEDPIVITDFEVSTWLEDGIYETETEYDEYMLVFKTIIDEGNFALTLPSFVLWANGEIPILEVGTSYELSITRRKLNDGWNEYKAVLTPFKPAE